MRYKFAFQWCEEQGTPWWLAPRSVPRGPCAEPETVAVPEERTTGTRIHPTRDIFSLLSTFETNNDYKVETEEDYSARHLASALRYVVCFSPP